MISQSDSIRTRDGWTVCLRYWPANATEATVADKKRVLLGHSLGGLGNAMPDLALRNGLNPEWLCTDADVVSEYRRDPLAHNRVSGRLACIMLDAAKFVSLYVDSWTTPTLLLYSGADRCVCSSGSDRFSQAALKSMVETQVYANLKHEILNEFVTAGVYSSPDSWLRKFASNAAREVKKH